MAAEKLDTRIRREQIVQAALAVVAREGLARLSIGRVARRVRVVPSALYRHFGGKEQIVDAMLAMVQERLIENVQSARAASPDAVGRLRCLLDRHLALIAASPAIPRLVFSDAVYATDSGRRRRMFLAIRRYLDAVAAIIREGQRRGELRKGVDADAAALLFLGVVQPAAVLSRLGAGAFDPAAEAARAWPLLVAAIERR